MIALLRAGNLLSKDRVCLHYIEILPTLPSRWIETRPGPTWLQLHSRVMVIVSMKTFWFRLEISGKVYCLLRFLKFRSNSSTFGSHKLLMLRFSNLSGYFIANEKRAKFFRKFSVQILIGRGIMFSISNFFIIFPISVTMPRQVDQEPSVNWTQSVKVIT